MIKIILFIIFLPLVTKARDQSSTYFHSINGKLEIGNITLVGAKTSFTVVLGVINYKHETGTSLNFNKH
jgi:hypothetical protein